MITSTSNPKIKELCKLKQKKYRDLKRCYLVEGAHLVEESHRAGVLVEVVTSQPQLYQYENMIEVSDEVIAKLAFTNSPQPIIGICQMKIQAFDLKKSRYVLLDDLQDPGNIGTIVRTALAFNYDGVILSENSVDLYNDKFIRSTQGACFHIPCIKANLVEVIKQLHDEGVRVVGKSLHDAKEINTIQGLKKVAIVLGNEGNGVSEKVLECCDQNVYIPIQKAESLNVAIAGGICMFHFR